MNLNICEGSSAYGMKYHRRITYDLIVLQSEESGKQSRDTINERDDDYYLQTDRGTKSDDIIPSSTQADS